MSTFGFRAEKDKVHYAIADGCSESPILIEQSKFSAPKTYSLAQQLSWYRDRVQTLLQKHAPTYVYIRQAETFLRAKPAANALESMFTRARIEGVLLESVNEKGIPVESGKMQNLSSKLGSSSAKKYIEKGELRGLDLDGIKNKSTREAILAAVAVLEK